MNVAIITNFTDIQPGYSLTGIVEDQAVMLQAHGHQVALFVQEGFNFESLTPNLAEAEVRAVVPAADLTDYRSVTELSEQHTETAEETARSLDEALSGFDVAFTHDWCFTGWNLPHFLGLRLAALHRPDFLFAHWIHSIPTQNRDWWRVQAWGGRHRLVYPNQSDALMAAEQYRGDPEDVVVIPHIKDPRTWGDFGEDTRRFIDRYPALLSAEVVQVLPASVDRLKSKRLAETIKIFGAMKKRGRSVCLVAANQWATGRGQKEDVEAYKRLAESCGLVPDQEVIFSSDFGSEYEVGLPRRMVRDLFSLSNLFIFATDHESFGLVVPEAASAGVLPVLNRSLHQQVEISGGHGMFFDFGSYQSRVVRPDEDAWLDAAAALILGRLERERSLMLKTHVRRRYNYDWIYRRYYEPLLAEATAPVGRAA